jgi:hypothetical protein
MKKLIVGLSALTLLIAAVVSLPLSSQKAHAQDDEQQQQSSEQEQLRVVYRYAAQPGDSYTLMARKAVQTYGKKYEVNLSLAGILYAETNMTKEAGSPELGSGQQVEVAESTVKQWVENAQQLSDEAEAAWNYYVQFANFNTDNVGESR